jgi:hypothetical protein
MRNPFRRTAPPEDVIHEIDRRRGGILSLWAGIESSIDKANHYGWLYSDKSVSKVVPVGLQRKIDTFKKINRDLLPFGPLRASAVGLMDWLDKRYEDRHWMAHGFLIPWDCKDGSWHFVKHEFLRDGSIKDLHRTFTRDELVTITNDLCELGFTFGIYGQALAEQVKKHPPNNKGG